MLRPSEFPLNILEGSILPRLVYVLMGSPLGPIAPERHRNDCNEIITLTVKLIHKRALHHY